MKREVDYRSLLHDDGTELFLTEEDMEEIAYEVEEAISDILCQKLIRAYKQSGAKMMCLA